MRAIIFAITALLPTLAFADGASSYKDEQPRASYRTTNDRGDVRAHLTASERAELRRIHRRALARMQADRDDFSRRIVRRNRIRYAAPVQPRYADPRPVRVVRDYRTTERDSGLCKPAIAIEGRERGGRPRALTSANNAWLIAVQNRWGFSYANINDARIVSQSCNMVRRNLFGVSIYVCSVNARPCRS